MSLFKSMDKSIKKFHWYDISLIKISAAAAILLVAKFFPVLLLFHWKIYLIVALIAAIRPLYLLLKK